MQPFYFWQVYVRLSPAHGFALSGLSSTGYDSNPTDTILGSLVCEWCELGINQNGFCSTIASHPQYRFMIWTVNFKSFLKKKKKNLPETFHTWYHLYHVENEVTAWENRNCTRNYKILGGIKQNKSYGENMVRNGKLLDGTDIPLALQVPHREEVCLGRNGWILAII